MEILYANALLIAVGYDRYDLLDKQIDKLFLSNLQNDDYLSLIERPKDKNLVLHIIATINIERMNIKHFGAYLMRELYKIYLKTNLESFVDKMYHLYTLLPAKISENEPFYTFCYADDCLSYGDEIQCRQLYEKAMSYYQYK